MNKHICFLTMVGFSIALATGLSAHSYEVTAASCSANDIDTAIAQVTAADGGTVFLPACDVDLGGKNFHVGGGIQVIGNGQDSTVLRGAVFTFSTQHYGSVGDGLGRLSGMSIVFPFDQTNGMYFEFRKLAGMRVDHLSFEGKFSTMANVSLPESDDDAWLLFDHCAFDLITSYGIYTFGNNDYRENIASNDCINLFGTGIGAGGAVFIEDCVFNGYYDHLMDGRTASHYVFRHNTVIYDRSSGGTGGGPIEGHGPTTPGTPDYNEGTNCMEISDVTITQTISPSGAGILFRSGCGVVYNTTVINQVWGIALAVEGSPYNWIDHPYPADNQPHGLWFWDNTFTDIEQTDIGIVWSSDSHIVEDRDYFLRAPTQQADGFTYASYPYPHPAVASLFADGFESGDTTEWTSDQP